MPPSFDVSRRRILKLISGAPLLPLASGGSASFLQSAIGASTEAAASSLPALGSSTFNSMAATSLANPSAMASTTVNYSLVATYKYGHSQTFNLHYEPFFLTGVQVPDGKGGNTLAGGYYDINNQPKFDTSGSTRRQFFSDCPDGSSLLTLEHSAVPGVKGNAV